MVLARHKQRVSTLFQRFPLLGRVGQRVYRLWQARFSVGAVGVVFNDAGQILLLKHVYRPRYLWGLPGGWVSRRENPARTVERELMEETGLQVRVLAPLWVDQGVWLDHLDLAYLCRAEGPCDDLRLSGESLDYHWLLPEELPELLAFQQQAVAHALELRKGL